MAKKICTMESLVINMDLDFWKNKRVMVTGHTGFKGGWLTLILERMGCIVIGVSIDDSGQQSLYRLLDLQSYVKNSDFNIEEFNDILFPKNLEKIIDRFDPEVVFHLAAQPLVIDSYNDPSLTYNTNIIGTLNVLEALKNAKSLKAIVSVTTDKVYQNKNQIWGYRETDNLGGYDPYSASKSCADILTQSHYHSFFKKQNIGVSTVRAGNVIGGGDWSKNRLIPDTFRSIKDQTSLRLRYPNSTRPWQHVVDPLSGYLMLAEKLCEEANKFSVPFNFGPNEEDILTVQQVVNMIEQRLSIKIKVNLEKKVDYHEAEKLHLDCSFAKCMLHWRPKWKSIEAIGYTAEWYDAFLTGSDMAEISNSHLDQFFT